MYQSLTYWSIGRRAKRSILREIVRVVRRNRSATDEFSLSTMITAAQITDGRTYLTNHLTANDYYAEGETVCGEWFGAGAEMLGLRGTVQSHQFDALRRNQHPLTREKLTARNRRAYKARNPFTGKRETRNPVVMHDINLSAPKSVSIAAMLGDDERIHEAFAESVRFALKELEQFAAVRERRGQQVHTENARATGNMVAGVFHHNASRALDPQLHAHAVIANATYDAERDRWLALQPRPMMEASSRFVRQAMDADLARRLEALGYRTEPDGDSFRLADIPIELEKRYSTRARQREAFVQRFEQLFGEVPSKKRVEAFIKDDFGQAVQRFASEYEQAFGQKPSREVINDFVRDSRSQKLARLPTEKVRQRQLERVTEGELGNLLQVIQGSQRRASRHTQDTPETEHLGEVIEPHTRAVALADTDNISPNTTQVDTMEEAITVPTAKGPVSGEEARAQAVAAKISGQDVEDLSVYKRSLDKALGHCMERSSVVSVADILGQALRFGSRWLDPTRLRTELMVRNEIISDGILLTTKAALWEEEQVLRFARESKNCYAKLGDEQNLPSTLQSDQHAAAVHLCQSTNGIEVLEGKPGTGKTFLLMSLQEAHHGLTNRDLVVLAPTTRATDGLREEGLASASTVAGFLRSHTKQDAARHATLVIDEAGMLSGQQMAQLTHYCRQHGARMVLVGDTKQHEAVPRGNALRNLTESGLVRPITLAVSRRQKHEEHRHFAQLLSNGQAEDAISWAQSDGMICEQADETALLQEAAQHYANAVAGGREILAVIPAWKDIDAFTEHARLELRQLGKLSEDEITVAGSKSLSWTEAERVHWSGYKPGLKLIFHRRTKEVKKGETLTVERSLPNGLLCTARDGREVRVTRKQAKAFDITKDRHLRIAVGDVVMILASCDELNISNGTRRKVASIEDGKIQLSDGNIIPDGFTQFSHGHAVTSHRAQGANVQESMLVLTNRSLAVADQKHLLVANTRFRESHRIFTTSIAKLSEAASRENVPQLAWQFLKQHGVEIDALKNANAPDTGSITAIKRISRRLRNARKRKASIIKQAAKRNAEAIRQARHGHRVLRAFLGYPQALVAASLRQSAKRIGVH
jgi:conjugative relaxase-like TrwC/TraI family protein